MIWVDVKSSHKTSRVRTAHLTIEPSGRPGRPPPNRARPRRSSSSSEVTFVVELSMPRRRRGGSLHGPPDGGSPPPLPSPPLPEGPHGPLLSLNRPRALA